VVGPPCPSGTHKALILIELPESMHLFITPLSLHISYVYSPISFYCLPGDHTSPPVDITGPIFVYMFPLFVHIPQYAPVYYIIFCKSLYD